MGRQRLVMVDCELEEHPSFEGEGLSEADAHQVLLLNADYSPLQIISWKRAITLLETRKVYVVQESAFKARTPTRAYPIPSVVVVKRYCRVPTHMPLSRFALGVRDHHTCQYCGETLRRKGGNLTVHDLTIDHVYPKSKGGPRSWENLVLACMSCNQRKGNRTPQEAKMVLRTSPRVPQTHEVVKLMIVNRQGKVPSAWLPYLST